MAPEACQGRYFSGKIHDMWQLGVTLYACVFGCVPSKGPRGAVRPEGSDWADRRTFCV